jgi:hypothetical protein
MARLAETAAILVPRTAQMQQPETLTAHRLLTASAVLAVWVEPVVVEDARAKEQLTAEMAEMVATA